MEARDLIRIARRLLPRSSKRRRERAVAAINAITERAATDPGYLLPRIDAHLKSVGAHIRKTAAD